MKNPLVSAIVPVYNGEATIAEAIRSVLSQEFKAWELIVVNDGSTDGTARIVSGFRDVRIHSIQQANQGLAAARNAGIRVARGDYLAFLDADDAWEPGFMARCLEVMQAERSRKLAGVYTSCVHIDSRGALLPQRGNRVVAADQLYDRLLEGGFFPPNVMFLRADLVRSAGMFDTNLPGQGTEDWDLWLRLSRKHAIEGIPEPLARYRVSTGSMSTNAAKMHACRMGVLAKQFGRPEGRPESWSAEKRKAYGFAYRNSGLGFIEQNQPDLGWQYLNLAFSIWPALLNRVDTFYELACGNQPKGMRGVVVQERSGGTDGMPLDIQSNGEALLARLEAFFQEAKDLPGVAPEQARQQAMANAYLALAMLSDSAGRYTLARSYMLRALKARPRLLASGPVARRTLRLLAAGWRAGANQRQAAV